MFKRLPFAAAVIIAAATAPHAQSVFDSKGHCHQAMGFMETAQQKAMEDHILSFAATELGRELPDTAGMRDRLTTHILQVCFQLQDGTFEKALVALLNQIKKYEDGGGTY